MKIDKRAIFLGIMSGIYLFIINILNYFNIFTFIGLYIVYVLSEHIWDFLQNNKKK